MSSEKPPVTDPKQLSSGSEGSPTSIDLKDKLKRITLRELWGFLGMLSVGSWFLIFSILGGVFYIGTQWPSDKKSPTAPPVVPVENLKELSALREELTARRLELDTIKQKLAVLAKEKEELTKQVEELERVREDTKATQTRLREVLGDNEHLKKDKATVERQLSSQRVKGEDLQKQLSLERNKTAALGAKLAKLEQTVAELKAENKDLQATLVNKKLQEMFRGFTEQRSYVIWVPEQASGYSLYIDGTHHSLFKCLRKIEPKDLLELSGEHPAYFSIKNRDMTISRVPYLLILEVTEGEHQIQKKPVPGALHPAEDSKVELGARQVEFLKIDSVEVYTQGTHGPELLRTLDQYAVVRGISKIIESMRLDNECLREPLRGR